MKKRSGQAATEYIMIVAFAMMVILPATYFFYSYSHATSYRIKESQLNKMAKEILINSEKVYYLGYPSMVTIESQFPDNIKYMQVWRNWSNKTNEINFWVDTGSDVSERSYPGDVNMLGFFDEKSLSEGTKNVKVMASVNKTGAPYVLLTIDSRCVVSIQYDAENDGDVDANDFGKCSQVPCIGQAAAGACQPCDYNGNCNVDNNDLVLWNILTTGNNPPYASISGPANAINGNPVTYFLSAVDVDDRVITIRLYYTPVSSNNPALVDSCAGVDTCQKSWTPSSTGAYYVFIEVLDSSVKCTGNPFGATDGTADCGFNDYLTVTVT